MKRLIVICLILSLLCTLTIVNVSAANEEIKYDFDSADELNDWQTLGGSWKIQDGCLKQTSGTPGAWNIHCSLKNVKVKDFTARFRIKVAKENLGMGWAGFYFRKVNLTDHQEQSGYGLTIEGKSSKGKTVLLDWAHSCKTFEGEVRANANDWNEVVISVSGNVIKVYLNDDIATRTPTLEIVDKDNGWMDAGYVSFASGNSKIDVDYFYLYTGASQDKAFSGGTVSTEPTDPPTEPTDPKPTDPEPTDPEPTDPEPTDPEPTDPEPTDPEPTDPEPTDPEPTDPEPTDPEPTDPEPTDPEPTESEDSTNPTQPTDPQPTDPKPEPKPENNPLSLILLIVGAGGIVCVVVIYLISNKRKKG